MLAPRQRPACSGRFRGLWLACSLATCCTGCGATGGWVMNNSGMGYYQQGNYAMARHEFAMAVAEAPWNADYRHNLALTMKKSGDIVTAERVLRHNLSINSMHQPTYHTLALLYNEQGRQGEAHQLVQTWAETQPYVAAAHIEMAWLQREMGNIPDAERELRTALQIEPYNPIALAHLGQVYQDAGQSSQAAAMYQRSLAVNIDQPQVQSRLAAVSGTPYVGPNGPAGPRMAYQSPMLPAPLFDGAMMASSPQMMPAAFNQPMMSSPSMPAGMPMSSTPMETIIIPTTTMESGPLLPASTNPAAAAPSMTTAPSPTPIPSGTWQAVPQSSASRTNADPAHVPEMTALPTVEAH